MSQRSSCLFTVLDIYVDSMVLYTYTTMKPTLSLCAIVLFMLSSCQQEEITELRVHQKAVSPNIDLRSEASPSGAFPYQIPLPDGFSPEGITSGQGTDFYVGSLNSGAIYKGSYQDGSGSILLEETSGGIAVGMDFDQRTKYLFVSGGGSGLANIYDVTTTEEIASIPLGGAFINDVIVTKDAAYFTDSFQPVFYKVPLMPNGSLPDTPDAETIPLSGDFVFVQGQFNSNGIATTPNGKKLIIINSSTGKLYLVDKDSGEALQIDLGGELLTSGDGILLEGYTLYVVRNFLNQIAVVSLGPDYTSGTVTNIITSPDFRIPTTAASFGSGIYAVNARFDVAPPGSPNSFEFDVIRVDK